MAAWAQANEGDDGSDFVDPNQLTIDSLLSVANSGVHDSIMAKCFCNIGKIAENVDTVLKYSDLSLKICGPDNYALLGQNCSNKGWAYYMKDENANAVNVYNESLANFWKAGDQFHIAVVLVALAKCYHELNVRDSIFPYFNKALEIFTDFKDTAYISYVYRAIGIVNADLGFDDNAAVYFRKAIVLDSASRNWLDLGGDYLNLSYVERDPMLSLKHAKTAVKLFDSIPSRDSYFVLSKYDAYRTIAQAYIDVALSLSQKEYADSCLMYVNKVGNMLLTHGGYDNHLRIRMIYAKYLSFVGKYNEVVDVLLECEQYLSNRQIRNSMVADFYEALSDAYEKIGDFKKSKEHYKKMHEYSKKYANDSTLNLIANFKTEQALSVQEAEKKQLYADRQRMKIIMISLICGLVLVSLLFFYIIRALDIKRKANVQLSEKNNMLNAQKKEIAIQRDEIAMQNDMITEQWREVETMNKKLISSIQYARRIQKAVVSSEADVMEIFPESFIFYRPRDIVSGDFYHSGHYGRYSVMVVADCTGHGIPGAFLSMLGISALKEYLASESDAEMPGVVLDRMRTFVKSTLESARDGKNAIDDGMDMTICCYDFAKMELRYAIANQTVIIIRGGEAIKLKGDQMPVGRFVREKEHFSTLTTPIQKGDMIYAFSDGIQDQLGGTDRRKYLQRNMVDLFLTISGESMECQSKLLEQSILDWRGETPQVDDITLIGIRV